MYAWPVRPRTRDAIPGEDDVGLQRRLRQAGRQCGVRPVARTPTGDGVIQRAHKQPAFSDDLLEQVLQGENLHTAWKQVRANEGGAGIDGITIDAFPAWASSG